MRHKYYGEGRLKKLYHPNTNMDSYEYKLLHRVASLQGMSISQVLRIAFEEYVANHKELSVLSNRKDI